MNAAIGPRLMADAPTSRDARQKMVSKDHKLSVRRQCALLTLTRSSLYYEPKGGSIRPVALQRKNALFAGHDAGAQNWATLASLIETCKLNKIEPHRYLTGVITAIVNGHKQKHIDQLLPWNFRG